ncbi:MAG: L,D-transpeptidase family protein [Frankiaceae bacterium]
MRRFPQVAIAVVVSAVPMITVIPSALAAAPPAATVTGHRVGDGRVSLAWRNPTGSGDFARVRLVYAAGHVPAAIGDGTEAALSSPTATSAVVTGLTDGQPYSFVLFTADAADNATASSPVTATPHPAQPGHLTAHLGRSAIGPGAGASSTVLSGTYADATGHAVAGLRVRVMRRLGGTSTWERVATVTSSATGRVAMTATPARTAYYRFFLPGSPYDAATYSGVVRLVHVPALSMSAPTLARTYTPFAVSGTVKPVMGGQAVVLRRYYSGAWHTIARTTTGSLGHYRFSLTPTTTAPRQLRAVLLATARHSSARTASHAVQVTPRDLRSGMSGPDVRALQQRLAALHYDVGTVDGQFGYDTLHAVVPFQKLNGEPRTGVVGAQTLARLGSPTRPTRHHLVSGRSVEVDKARQIAVLYASGAVYRILDVSTGSGQPYVQDGHTYVATTPVGSFAVNRKINGMRVSQLGELWKPSYFYLGYAIHGSPSVPAYPASHGCVRVTNPAVDRYFSWLTLGTRVYVFD